MPGVSWIAVGYESRSARTLWISGSPTRGRSRAETHPGTWHSGGNSRRKVPDSRRLKQKYGLVASDATDHPLLVLRFSSLHLFSSECRPRQDSELVVLSCVQVDHPLLALLFSSLHLFSSECRPSLPFGAPPCLRHGIHASDP